MGEVEVELVPPDSADAGVVTASAALAASSGAASVMAKWLGGGGGGGGGDGGSDGGSDSEQWMAGASEAGIFAAVPLSCDEWRFARAALDGRSARQPVDGAGKPVDGGGGADAIGVGGAAGSSALDEEEELREAIGRSAHEHGAPQLPGRQPCSSDEADLAAAIAASLADSTAHTPSVASAAPVGGEEEELARALALSACAHAAAAEEEERALAAAMAASLAESGGGAMPRVGNGKARAIDVIDLT